MVCRELVRTHEQIDEELERSGAHAGQCGEQALHLEGLSER